MKVTGGVTVIINLVIIALSLLNNNEKEGHILENTVKKSVITKKLVAILMALAFLVPLFAFVTAPKSEAAGTLYLDGKWQLVGVVTPNKNKDGYATVTFVSNGSAMDIKFTNARGKTIWSENRSITPPKSHMGIYSVSRKYKFGKDNAKYYVYAKLSNTKYQGQASISATKNCTVTQR